MTITTNTTDRKALAKAIAEELGTTARYMGMPSCGYQIGDFTVDRDGNISGEDFTALQDFLTRNGYEIPDLDTPAEEQPAEEMPADSEHVTSMDISIPAHDVTVAQLKNLTHAEPAPAGVLGALPGWRRHSGFQSGARRRSDEDHQGRACAAPDPHLQGVEGRHRFQSPATAGAEGLSGPDTDLGGALPGAVRGRRR